MTDLKERADLEQRAGQEAERKRLDAIWWGGALIWLGVVFAAERLDLLPAIGADGEWWPWIFLGLGPWALVMNSYRALSNRPDPTTWDWVWTAIFMGVGLVAVLETGVEIIGAVILVVLGLVVLLGALLRGGRTRAR